MKFHFAMTVLAIGLAASLARADWTLQWHHEGGTEQHGKEPDKMTMRVKDDSVRMDIGDQASIIVKNGGSDVIMLMHQQKLYMKGLASPAADDAAAKQIKPQATGRTEKINGFDTAEYVADTKGGKETYWICKDFPHYKELGKTLAMAFRSQTHGNGFLFDPDVWPGMPIRMIGSKSGTSTLLSSKDDSLDDSIFKVPADYKEPGGLMPAGGTPGH